MAERTRDDIRNLAIIAHVDHGKTTLVDALLWQSRLLAESDGAAGDLASRVDLEREKAINVMPPLVSFEYRGTRFNILDAPGQADPGDRAQRVFRMADGVVLIVDACEGPAPPTRFALRKALEAGLAPLVVLNKIDLPGSRPAEVLEEIRETFIDLDASEAQQRFPIFFCNALQGLYRADPQQAEQPLVGLLEHLRETVPPPAYDDEAPLQLLICSRSYDDFLGRLAIGRVFHGSLTRGARVSHCRLDGDAVPARVAGIYGHDGLRRVELERAGPGDIVEINGVEQLQIGETLSDPEDPRPLPPIRVGEPVISVLLGVNDSPMASLDGEHVSADKLRERLWTEILTNVTIRVEETESSDTFRLAARGELQIAILLEMMRREGFEMSVGRPAADTRRGEDGDLVPMERLVLDLPEQLGSIVAHRVEARGGRLGRMVNHGTGRVRMEYRIPALGLIGFRSEFLSDTRGTGIMSHEFDGWAPSTGEVPGRSTGVLVADRPGRCTVHAIDHLQHRGTLFVAPGDQVYAGMIVGENSRANDLEVNITKLRPTGAAPGGREVRLIPPRTMSLEQALAFLRDDEIAEVTPRALRLRKRVLGSASRPGPV